MSENQYAPGTYVKGDDERVAKSASQAVALVFQGFSLKGSEAPADEKPVETPTPTPSPRELARNKPQEDNQS